MHPVLSTGKPDASPGSGSGRWNGDTSESVSPSKLHAAQVEQLYYQASMGLYGSIVSSVLMVVVFWSLSPHSYLIAWWITMMALYALRHTTVLKFRRSPTAVQEPAKWEMKFAVYSGISGMLWAVGVVLFFPPSSPIHQQRNKRLWVSSILSLSGASSFPF